MAAKRLAVGLAMLLAFLAGMAGRAGAEVVEPPVRVALTVVAEPRNERVVGRLVGYDDVAATLLVGEERRRYPWSKLTPTSAFIARQKLVDEGDAGQWVELAAFARRVGAERQAIYAGKRALRIDGDLQAEVDAALTLPLGELQRGGVVADDDPTPAAVPIDPPDEVDGLPPKFLPVTAQAAQEAEADARREAVEAARLIGVRLREVSTPHFLIFTDWEPIDDAWLAEQLEGAYALLCREFDVDDDQPVFIGRLPVYMFHDNGDMLRYAQLVDGFGGPGMGIAAYHFGRSDGIGKMVMSKPIATDSVPLPLAQQLWRRTLTHEFVHAFLARYRGNGFLPRWMNEGLAEMLAETILPRPGAFATARMAAARGTDISFLFDDANLPGGEMYPVMMSITQALYRDDPGKFVNMVDRIKSGEDAEAVLRELYDVDYAGLEEAWRGFMLRR